MKQIRITVFSKIIIGITTLTVFVLMSFGAIIYNKMTKIDREAFESSFMNIISEVDVAIENYFESFDTFSNAFAKIEITTELLLMST